MSTTVTRYDARAVRTRFAPSSTGFLHIGWYRIGIFSWLLARRHGGQFLLRVEDTDQRQLVRGVVEDFLEMLDWLGIDSDEGPVVGGPHGPYYQSQRREIYASYAEFLIEGDHAYRCFCTKERIDAVDRSQKSRPLPAVGYDRHCRGLTQSETQAKLAAGTPFVVRFKVALDGVTRVVDALRGEIEFDNGITVDPILLRSDGYPTYHLATVIDDHLMDISHVLRHEDSLSSSPLHKMIYDALGWEWPQTAHIPSVLGTDGKRLSKRHGAHPLRVYRDQGYLPEAIINYLATLGCSFDSKKDIYSVSELQSAFSLNRISRSGAVFDQERLKWMNGVYIRRLGLDDLLERSLPFLGRREQDGGLPDRVARPLDGTYLRHVLRLAQQRVKLLSEIPDLVAFFFNDQLSYPAEWLIGEGMDTAQSNRGLVSALKIIKGVAPWSAGSLEERMRQLAVELDVRPGSLFMILRVALTGRKETPPLFETMEVLGRERTVKRLDEGAAQLVGGH